MMQVMMSFVEIIWKSIRLGLLLFANAKTLWLQWISKNLNRGVYSFKNIDGGIKSKEFVALHEDTFS